MKCPGFGWIPGRLFHTAFHMAWPFTTGAIIGLI
jgi:hypothetical protein